MGSFGWNILNLPPTRISRMFVMCAGFHFRVCGLERAHVSCFPGSISARVTVIRVRRASETCNSWVTRHLFTVPDFTGYGKLLHVCVAGTTTYLQTVCAEDDYRAFCLITQHFIWGQRCYPGFQLRRQIQKSEPRSGCDLHRAKASSWNHELYHSIYGIRCCENKHAMLIAIFKSWNQSEENLTFYQGCGVGGKISESDSRLRPSQNFRLRLLNIKGMKFVC